MSLIAYIPKGNESGRRLQRMIGQLIWPDSIEIFFYFNRFDYRLRQLSGDEDIVLLCASTPQDLDTLIDLGQLLTNLRLILILPDRETKTVAKGHLLRPRFISYLDSDFSELALVLKKMEKIICPYPRSIPSEFMVPRGGVKPHPPSFSIGGKIRGLSVHAPLDTTKYEKGFKGPRSQGFKGKQWK